MHPWAPTQIPPNDRHVTPTIVKYICWGKTLGSGARHHHQNFRSSAFGANGNVRPMRPKAGHGGRGIIASGSRGVLNRVRHRFPGKNNGSPRPPTAQPPQFCHPLLLVYGGWLRDGGELGPLPNLPALRPVHTPREGRTRGQGVRYLLLLPSRARTLGSCAALLFLPREGSRGALPSPWDRGGGRAWRVTPLLPLSAVPPGGTAAPWSFP